MHEGLRRRPPGSRIDRGGRRDPLGRFLGRAIVVLGAGLSATPAGAAEALTVWHAYRTQEKSVLERAVARYNARGSGPEVRLVSIPYDTFASKVTTAIPKGRGPDLFIFAQDRLGDWAASGLIESVDFWVTDEVRARYLPPTLDALTYDDQVFGLPVAFKMVALFYNPKLIEAPPKTTDELIRVAKAVTVPSENRFGLVYQNADFFYQGMWLQGFGGRVFDARGRPMLDAKPFVDALAFAQRLAREEGIMPQEVSSILVSTLFKRGQAAMVINGPWFLGELDPDTPCRVAPLPIISETGQPARPFLATEAVIMSARARDKLRAFEVMAYLASAEVGLAMAKEARQMPANRAVYDDPEVARDPIVSVFKAQLAHSVPTPNIPAMQVVWSPAETAMKKVVNGGVAPLDAAQVLQAEVERFLKGAAW